MKLSQFLGKISDLTTHVRKRKIRNLYIQWTRMAGLPAGALPDDMKMRGKPESP
jgi:hypothetical protein